MDPKNYLKYITGLKQELTVLSYNNVWASLRSMFLGSWGHQKSQGCRRSLCSWF